jgi:HPt (histidine-containing phosphotransfer) domain-containing protein
MLLHTIAGSAGSFGYAELGDRSRQLEHRISAALIATDPQQSSTSKQFHAEFNEEIRQFMQWISINVAPKDSP